MCDPNLGEIGQRLRAYDDGRHLFGSGFARCQALAALPLHLGHAPGTRRAAFQTLSDVAAQPLELESVQLILPFHKAQRLAHDFAGGVVASRIDLLADELLELRGQIDVQGHGRFTRSASE